MLEGRIDDERQFKTAKRWQGISSRTAAANTESMRICLNDLEQFHFNSSKYRNDLLRFIYNTFIPYGNWIEKWIQIETFQDDLNKVSTVLASGKSN